MTHEATSVALQLPFENIENSALVATSYVNCLEKNAIILWDPHETFRV